MNNTRKTAALMGALTADAAALGLHWIYDPQRIAQIVADGSAAFRPIDPANYEGVPAYFAHALRRNGMTSQYGNVLTLAMLSITSNGGTFNPTAFQSAYSAHFGRGGTYQGYIDRVVHGTLDNLANEKTDPSGIDDDQLPAVATLPAIVVRYGADAAQIETAIRITNVNADASRYGLIFAQTLDALLKGTPLKTALTASDEPALQAALSTSETDSVAYGETTKRACHLPMGMPLSWHILNTTTSFEDAIEQNIKAGGDSCGRAMVIGALAGAAYDLSAIPLNWTLKLDRAQYHLAQAKALSSL